ncbi:MAG: GNAT family N-acetyltransferase [Candidatus Eisenbacteria bacterium]|mgnify:CR=1 FL=1
MTRPLPDRIETARLVLREPRNADAGVLFAAYTQDPAVARYTTWRPHGSMAQTEAFIHNCVDAWSGCARSPYVLTLRPHDEAVGMLEARFQGHVVDIGYVMRRSLWGQGLMSEAIHAMAEAIFEVPRFFRIQATCDVANTASSRALERAGFVREGELDRHTVHPNISDEPRRCYMYARCRSAAPGPPKPHPRPREGAEVGNIVLLARPSIDENSLNLLFSAAWPGHQVRRFGAVLEHSLAYVCAFDADRLVGFVNLSWDGAEHAFLLDPTVHPDYQRRGIGTSLVNKATSIARDQGVGWLHVDYEPPLAAFYRGCGFRPTPAGVIDLAQTRREGR